MQRCSEKRNLNLKLVELQEDTERIQLNQEKLGGQMKKTISTLETKIAQLLSDNKEMRECLSDLTQQNMELKQTLLKWQKDLVSEIAKKLCTSSEQAI